MSSAVVQLAPREYDDPVEGEIAEYLNLQQLRSFFLTAGAGSGKTRSLEYAVKGIRAHHRESMSLKGQRVAVVTFTNAACHEISERVFADPLFEISTIHSFCWKLIGAFHADIRRWLQEALPRQIEKLKLDQDKGKPGTKATIDRERAISSNLKRLDWLATPRRFTYNPNGDNFGMASLNHGEVMDITASFLTSKSSMQAVLVNSFPILLVDEAQDTNKNLIDALLSVESTNRGNFAVGLIGDEMQRIYFDGKERLKEAVPEHWAKPVKVLNHRCPRRVIRLANALRSPIDAVEQRAPEDSQEGVVRLFIGSSSATDKPNLELGVMAQMATLTNDPAWETDDGLKILTLEHHMAASRRNFLELFNALDRDSSNRTGLRRGDLPGLRLFSNLVHPIVNKASRLDDFAMMNLLREYSPLLGRKFLVHSSHPEGPLGPVRDAVKELQALKVDDASTTFYDVLRCVSKHNLFEIPNVLKPFLEPENLEQTSDDEEADPSSQSEASRGLSSWREFLDSPYRQIAPYAEFVANAGRYGTHQGVKGQQFDRVMVIMDDQEARGFTFSYNKLLGGKKPSAKKQKADIVDPSLDALHTRKLLYVTCTRAKKSLALVAYAEAPEQMRDSVIAKGWFEAHEIISI